jgi:hypothetical protein
MTPDHYTAILEARQIGAIGNFHRTAFDFRSSNPPESTAAQSDLFNALRAAGIEPRAVFGIYPRPDLEETP